jgi:glycolate oxidase FAD binding subunit
MDQPTCTIDGFGPLPLVRPDSVQTLSELIKQAAATSGALYPVGGQTMLSIGNTPTKPGQAVDMRGLANVIDFPARDMTVTVQAGITMRALSEMLAKENLRLPIDVPNAERATLGGVIAANVSGPRRLGYGTLRDYVIGISALNDEGREFKAGGRVVKNVAGYDLCKLLVGSLGTLGIITQVTLKLRPLAEHQAIACIGCDASQLEPLLAAIHGSRSRPICVELLNATATRIVFDQAGIATPETPWTLLVGYDGNFDATDWQLQQLVREIGAHGQLKAYVDYTGASLWNAVVEFAGSPERAIAFKANLLPNALAAFCQSADPDCALCAHAGSGIVLGQWPASMNMDRAASTLTAWRERAAQAQGTVVVSSCPAAWKSTLNVWGPLPNDVVLMREVKAAFDPKRIFNPGRFVDGI